MTNVNQFNITDEELREIEQIKELAQDCTTHLLECLVDPDTEEKVELNEEDKKDSCKNKGYGLSELFSDYNKLLKQIDKINKKVENTSISHKKIAESDDRDITVEDSLINIHNVISKFSRCIQISIEIDEQNKDKNVLNGQMSIDEI